MPNSCIFCQIAKNEIDSYKIYEDNFLYAMLDIFPASEGHCLIITKKHFRDFRDLPEDIASQVLIVAKKIVKALENTLDPKGFNILQNSGKEAGQEVMHYHLHIVPRYSGKTGLINIFIDKGKNIPTKEEFLELQKKLKKEINK